MNRFSLILLFVFCFFVQFSFAQNYTLVEIDKSQNLLIPNSESTSKKTIFPVMLYGFLDWQETQPNGFWNEINNWGINIVYSWEKNAYDLIAKEAKKQNVFVMGHHDYTNNKPGLMALPDEPIGAGTATVSEIETIVRKRGKNYLYMLNHDVSPYYFRIRNNKRINGFSNKDNCTWCGRRKGTLESYDEYNQYADIISFDYYPFSSKGIIDNKVEDFGKSSVGEFTALLKNNYPTKPIWAVIQTLWFSPYTAPYEGHIINSKIIRNLTFDAIIHSADGVSFFGHGQTTQYSKKDGYEFLKGKDVAIWKSTLNQCYELKVLQESYDKVLLENNLINYVNSKYGYALKKVKNSNKYYLFVVNYLNDVNNINIKSSNLPINMNNFKVSKIGKYQYPPLNYLNLPAESVDLTKEFKILKFKNGNLDLQLAPYGVAIISFEK